MNITADTNVLARAIVADDPEQARIAQSALESAHLAAIMRTQPRLNSGRNFARMLW